MIKFFVKNPVTTIMFVLFWVVLGLYSFPRMNIERTPAMDFPMATATFIYPGAAPAEIESQVIKKTEDAISEIAGVKRVTSNVFENGGYVMAEFNIGENINEKAAEMKNKLDSIATEFPADLKQPVVEKLNPMEQSVMDITLTGAPARDLEEYVRDTFGPKLTALSGVASVSVFGGEARAVRIFMNPDVMAAHGVTIIDIISALSSKNMNVPGGKIEAGTDSSNVRFIGEFQSIDEIKNLRITTVEGEIFKLGQVAEVSDSIRDVELGARYNSENVVIASVVKSNDGNAIKISNALRKNFSEYQSDITAKLPGAQMQIVSDSSIAISAETSSTINAIILGIILTILILLAFTRNWRSTVIAAVVIPASLVAGFFFMDTSGFTVNAMTLLAYSSALGSLIFNAIILIEAALQELAHGKNPDDAAIDGTKKVFVPILTGVGTNVVVFLPLAFMGGIVGQFMNQFGMTVVYVTLLSLLFSFSLTPMMIAKILKKKNKTSGAQRQSSSSLSWFKPLYDWQIRRPWLVICFALAVLIGSGTLLRFVGNEFRPSTDANEISVTIRAPMGSTYQKSESIAKQVEERLREFPEVESVSVKIGERGLQNIAIKTKLIDHSKRKISDKELAQKMLPRLANIADAEIQIKAGEAAGGGMIAADLVLNIRGEDDAKRENYALLAMRAINQIPEVQSAVLVQQKPGREMRFIPNQGNMNFWGISNAYAGATLRAALFGNDTYKYKENGKEYPIILEFAKPFKTSGMFDIVYVNSRKGLVALSELGNIENVRATPNISRVDKHRITEININIGKSTMGPVQKKIETSLKTIDWERGYDARFAGMSEIQDETTTEIGSAFLLATILTFMLLAAILNSWIHPFTIATSIVTSFAGVFIMLFLTGASINIAAMLAFVMLVGLVVNNNILLLEPAINRINAGEPVASALWTEFIDKKNMILMTSIAVMTGMLPQLWSIDGMKVSMGAVMIGGMMASLFWVFFLTPALFSVMERLRKKK